jgi:hypothetical protein
MRRRQQVPIQLPHYDGQVGDMAATHIGGDLFASLEGSSDVPKVRVSNFTWAKVADKRKPNR